MAKISAHEMKRLRAIANMSEPVSKLTDRFTRQMMKRNRDEIMTAYDQGWRVRAMLDDPRTGGDPAGQMATALGKKRLDVLELTRLPEAFDRDQIERITRCRMVSGAPLTLNHLLLIAQAPHGSACVDLIEQTLDDSLTVRQLKRVMREAGHFGPRAQSTSTNSEASAPMMKNITQMVRFFKNGGRRLSEWNVVVFDELEAKPVSENGRAELLDALQQAEQMLAELEAGLPRCRQRLEAIMAQMQGRVDTESSGSMASGAPSVPVSASKSGRPAEPHERQE